VKVPFLHKPKTSVAARAGVGWTRDLSEAGACVELAEHVRPLEPLVLRLHTDRGPIELEARVVWRRKSKKSEGGVLHGISFTNLAAANLRTFGSLLLFKGQTRDAGVRFPVQLQITCRPVGQARPISGWIGNMSRGGLLLLLPEAMAEGETLDLILHTPTGPMAASGVIAWVKQNEGWPPGELIRHGMRFTNLSWANSLVLALLIAVPS
jgi:hypothetical protein